MTNIYPLFQPCAECRRPLVPAERWVHDYCSETYALRTALRWLVQQASVRIATMTDGEEYLIWTELPLPPRLIADHEVLIADLIRNVQGQSGTSEPPRLDVANQQREHHQADTHLPRLKRHVE